MKVLKFKSIAGGIEKQRLYPVSSIVSINYTIAGNGTETLGVTFASGTEVVRNEKDIKKILAVLETVEGNKNEIDGQQKKLKEQIELGKNKRLQEQKRKDAQLKKAAEIRSKVAARVKKTGGKKKTSSKKVTKKKTVKKKTTKRS